MYHQMLNISDQIVEYYNLNSREYLDVTDVISLHQQIIPKIILQSFWAQNLEFAIGTLTRSSPRFGNFLMGLV